MKLNLFKWFLYNLFGKLVPPLVGFLTIPYLLDSMGKQLFGEFGALMTILVLLSILDFGITKAIVRDVASKRRALIDGFGSYASMFWQSYAFQFLMGFIGAGLLLILVYQMEWQTKANLINLNSNLHLFLLLLFIPIIVSSGVSRSLLEGNNKFKELNIIRAFFSILVYLSPLFVVYVFGMYSIIVLMALGVKALESVVLTIYVCNKEKLFHRPEFSFHYVGLLMPFGVWVMLSNIVSPMVAYGERFIVMGANGLSEFSSYYIAIELVTKSLIIVSALATASFSLESRLSSQGVKKSLITNLRYVVAFFYILISLLIFFEGELILNLWLNIDNSDQIFSILLILSIGLVFNAVSHTLLSTVYSLGRSFYVFISYLIQLPFYLLAVYFGAKYFGLVGVAFAWVGRVIVDFLILWLLSSKSSFRSNCFYLFNFIFLSFIFSSILFFIFYLISENIYNIWYRAGSYFLLLMTLSLIIFINNTNIRAKPYV
jgi:O-antigen/teichoic acid export membrane protein